MERIDFDTPGHFIGAENCRFFRHTHIDNRCISTVGDYHPASNPDGPMEAIGYGRTFETMVFHLDAGDDRWREQDFDAYNDAQSAADGHEAMVAKYLGEVANA